MTPLTRSLRNGAVTATAATALLALTGTAALAAGGPPAEVDVAHDCTAIDVSSSKAISNVVLAFADGDTQRFEDLPESRTGSFAGTGEHSGEVITTAWIKSGNNKSGDGPGYGERFDFDASACDAGQAPASAGSTGTDDGDGDGDDAESGDDGRTRGRDHAAKGSKDSDEAPEEDLQQGGDDGDDDRAHGSAGAGTDTGADAEAGAQDQATVEVGAAGTSVDDTEEVARVAADQQTPPARVLGAVLEREVQSGLRAADASEVSGAEQLPDTGTDAPIPLAAAVAALALGAGLLRRTSRRPA